jgi:hypothetical protein
VGATRLRVEIDPANFGARQRHRGQITGTDAKPVDSAIPLAP